MMGTIMDTIFVEQHEWHKKVAPRSVDFLDYVLCYAAEQHGEQMRKYADLPYIVHPMAVARLVGDMFPDVDMIAAAYLHDTVEDCDVSVSTLKSLFGGRVSRLVDDLTDVSRPEDGNRKIRKSIDRAHSVRSCGEAKAIKICDLIDNTNSIVECDPNFAVVYMREKKMLLDGFVDAGDVPEYAKPLLEYALHTVAEFTLKRRGNDDDYYQG